MVGWEIVRDWEGGVMDKITCFVDHIKSIKVSIVNNKNVATIFISNQLISFILRNTGSAK